MDNRINRLGQPNTFEPSAVPWIAGTQDSHIDISSLPGIESRRDPGLTRLGAMKSNGDNSNIYGGGGYIDPATGIVVNRDITRAQRGGPIGPALGFNTRTPPKTANPKAINNALSRMYRDQAFFSGAGVRPGASPPMNAVQAARGMSGSFIPPGSYNPNGPGFNPSPSTRDPRSAALNASPQVR